MTATTTRRAPGSQRSAHPTAFGADAPRPRTARLSLPRGKGRKVRVPELVVGVLLVAGCALAALLLQGSDADRTTVVAAARPIPRGTVVGVNDLIGVQLGGDTGMLISGDDAKTLLGKVAAVDIAADVPLNSSLFTSAAPLGRDEALSSVALDAGRFPPDLAPNDIVRLVIVRRDAVTGDSATLLEASAQVWSITSSDDVNANTIVTLRGPLALAEDLAAASTVQLARIEGA